MDYHFESLDPERFQMFCQALLVKEFPNVQCLPVAQPDGGRDAILYYQSEKDSRNFIVFQVKFVRKPLAEANPHKWLTDIVKEEAPKVKRLIKEGAEAYYLLTNVPGTAHFGSGSIDQVRTILDNAFKIPAECWWRDDLSRRLDNAWDLKWVYSEVMTGQDMLHFVLEAGLLEHKSRRTSAIRAYIRKQYEDDKEVRFKQVELQNKLFDLFIDVPITIRHDQSNDSNIVLNSLEKVIQEVSENIISENPVLFKELAYLKQEWKSLGAATMLLYPIIQERIPYIVLEGAPGQGKSTLAQYLCQVHRMRILGMNLETIPTHHRPLSARIPFKVDLRHLAAWLSKQNPFSSEESKTVPEDWHKSLEAFLAAQVRFDSGGFEFSVADLHEVARLSAFLLVLDGLDEVADISRRQEIVTEVIAGVHRLEASAASLQVVVTSRPAAFANSPGFPEDLFPHFELISLTKSQIDDYADRWTKARNLSLRDRLDVKRTLNEKLDQPHLRDLSRNSMQLAILLTLIHARSFLPDERTALYDSYVERFFDRETEKSSVVREHRNLLIDIHQYLAWSLHSEAEQGHDRGSISTEKLRRLLSDYLTAEGHDPSLSDKICTSAVERIVFLVSRVQGTFEFEVQPLREYFAARFLYETAPYSPPGSAKRGTRPDRFDAIARNFYWLNVTRFYAGCFSKGELSALVDSIQDLAQERGYRYISHPLSLSTMLLSDWVFAQKQKSMKEVVSLILDGLRSRRVLISQNYIRGPFRSITSNPLVLPHNCGKKELLEECLSILRNKPVLDYAQELVSILVANIPMQEFKKLWFRETLSVLGLERTRWLEYGLDFGPLLDLDTSDLESLLSSDPYNPRNLWILLLAGQTGFLETSKQRCDIVLNSILEGREFKGMIRFSKAASPLTVLNLFLNTTLMKEVFNLPERLLFSRFWRDFFETPLGIEDKDYINVDTHNEALMSCVEFIKVAENEFESTVQEWTSELTHWDIIVEKLRFLWGDRWSIYRLANLTGRIKPSELYEGVSNLLDTTKPLCRRIQYAKLHAEDLEWWKIQYEKASSELDVMLVSLILITWGDLGTIISLAEVLDAILSELSINNWKLVVNSMPQATETDNDQINNLLNLDEITLPEKLFDRIAVVIGMRANKEGAKNIYLKYFSDYEGSDPIVLKFCEKIALQVVKSQPKRWKHVLKIAAKSYANISEDEIELSSSFYRINSKNIPIKIAEEIAIFPEKYPRQLVYLAEAKCREIVASKIIPVAEIAKAEKWFED